MWLCPSCCGLASRRRGCEYRATADLVVHIFLQPASTDWGARLRFQETFNIRRRKSLQMAVVFFSKKKQKNRVSLHSQAASKKCSGKTKCMHFKQCVMNRHETERNGIDRQIPQGGVDRLCFLPLW